MTEHARAVVQERTQDVGAIPPARFALPGRTLPKHVAIVAMGGSCNAFINTANAQGGGHTMADEVWAINASAAVIQHDRAFVMDDLVLTLPREAQEGRKVAQEILKWLPKHPGPVYSGTAYPQYPALVEFPLRDVIQAVGGVSYFNTTVAHAIGFAIYLGVTKLSLYGCDYTYPDIHISESGRGCAEFLLGIAAAKGIAICVPPTTTLLDANVPPDTAIYGYPQGLRMEIINGQVRVTRGPFPTSTAGTETPT